MFYPLIDNEIIGFGPIALRWYGLSYLAGFVILRSTMMILGICLKPLRMRTVC